MAQTLFKKNIYKSNQAGIEKQIFVVRIFNFHSAKKTLHAAIVTNPES